MLKLSRTKRIVFISSAVSFGFMPAAGSSSSSSFGSVAMRARDLQLALLAVRQVGREQVALPVEVEDLEQLDRLLGDLFLASCGNRPTCRHASAKE